MAVSAVGLVTASAVGWVTAYVVGLVPASAVELVAASAVTWAAMSAGVDPAVLLTLAAVKLKCEWCSRPKYGDYCLMQ